MLTIRKHHVSSIVWGERASFSAGKLTLNKEQLIAASLHDLKNYEIDFEFALPGESKRIVHITDAVRPAKKNDGLSAFPGWLKGANQAGQGITCQLDNMAVMQSCRFSDIQEGIVDMSGTGALYSTFSKTINLVMIVTPLGSNIDKKELALDLKMMILRAAEYTASLAFGQSGGVENRYELGAASAETLPRIGYAYFIQAQGPLRNVHIYGEDCVTMKPRILAPEAILDGALVSGNYIIACQKNPTFMHQENPIIKGLFEQDGTTLSFRGVIVSTESSSLEGKKENAFLIAQLASEMRLDGILVTQEGGGHADVDLMLTLDECEKAGIKSVILTNEIAGPRGDLPPLVSYSDRADAIVTNGNNDQVIILDSVAESVGGLDILGGKFNARDGFETSLGIIYTSTNQLGYNSMKTIVY